MEKCIPVPESGCWFWLAAVNKRSGYGLFTLSTDLRSLHAHRVSYELFRSKIPEGMNVLHSCDIPFCVNPDHLRLGTQADNMNDVKIRKRSGMRGTRNKHARLDDKMVRDIRESTLAGVDLAKKYKVSKNTVYDVRNNRTWVT